MPSSVSDYSTDMQVYTRRPPPGSRIYSNQVLFLRRPRVSNIETKVLPDDLMGLVLILINNVLRKWYQISTLCITSDQNAVCV